LARTLLRNPFELAPDASPRAQGTRHHGARATPVCARCRSDDITCTATVQWSNESQEWQLANTFGLPVHCNGCNGPSDLTWLHLN
jgi:hypothetical protein